MLEDTPRTFVGATTFQVTGMTCGHCQRAVTEEISRIPGIQGHAVGEAGYTLIP
jgi:copper chaperone CopZ